MFLDSRSIGIGRTLAAESAVSRTCVAECGIDGELPFYVSWDILFRSCATDVSETRGVPGARKGVYVTWSSSW